MTIPVTGPPTAELTTGKRAELPDGARTVTPGSAFDYVLTATNRGTAAAVDVGMTDDLPRGLHFTSGDGCRAAGQVVTCASDRTLRPGESTSFRISVSLDRAYTGDGSDLGNIAVATSPSDADGADPSPTVFVSVSEGDDTATPAPGPKPGAGPESGSMPAAGAGPRTPLQLAFTGSQRVAGIVAVGLALAAAGFGLIRASRLHRARRS